MPARRDMLKRLAAAAIACAASPPAWAIDTARSAPETMIWTDSLTGFAIAGFDPVAYFTDQAPREGRMPFEVDWGGVTFRFVSAGNAEVFQTAPDVYAPRFGGHCALSLARGVLIPGNPNTFVVNGTNLYLFFSAINQRIWLSEANRYIAEASEEWSRKLAAREPAFTLGGQNPSGAGRDPLDLTEHLQQRSPEAEPDRAGSGPLPKAQPETGSR